MIIGFPLAPDSVGMAVMELLPELPMLLLELLLQMELLPWARACVLIRALASWPKRP